ncbi:glycoside hydrolase family 16 protein [Algoriphagus sp.]|uniref:glycoside hydrolase family 16 protein n=1 Tax=Algoriphagus sp. TaxID=1872435 RepID=UPI0025D1750E|nr:glycoside hydrolase family 16 protein [Algoriphagus sp.]
MKKLSILFLLLMSNQIFAQKAKLIWADEFEKDGLPNPKNWSYNVGDHGWGNQELQFYSEARLENARVEDGKLIIEAKKDSNYPKGYTSARLVTKGKAFWKYGYIEVKAKLPTGRGTWPAIWMLAEENKFGGWPANGEIDIMEHVGFDPGKVHGTVHTEAFNHKIGTQKGGFRMVPEFNTEFHVYSIEWNKEKIDFYIDNKLYFTFEKSSDNYKEWPFDEPFHLILNIAVGGGWGGQQGVDPTIWPQKMEIDYVRVYNKKNFE